MIYELHRLRITGPLDVFETPVEVIISCLESHGIEPDMSRLYNYDDGRYRKKCIDKLNECKPIKISSKRDYGKAVRYINSKTGFQNEALIKCSLDHLQRWERQTTYSPNSFLGGISEENPTAVDITMLYKICRQKSLKTRVDMTFADLRRLCHLSTFDEGMLRDMLIDRVQTSQLTDLVNMVVSMGISEQDNLYDSYFKSRPINSLHDPLHIRFPKTDHEAVLMAAFNFKRDISEASDPMKEYAVLMKDIKFFPVDNYLIHLQTVDKYALHLDQRFNPNLPECVYHEDDLSRMAVEEGWSRSADQLSPFHFLKNNYMTNTFFAFKKGPMISVQPENQDLVIECQAITDLSPSNIVLYGSRSDKNHMVAFSWSELTSTFEQYKEFRNPVSSPPDIFPSHVIRKLNILARKPCPDESASRSRKCLIAAIERIMLDKKILDERLKNIQENIARDPSYKTRIEKILKRLYNISMMMREDNDKSQDTAAMEIYNFLSDPSVADSEIIRLPLVIYYPKSGIFSTSESAYEGYTIQGRLKIVQEGESTRAISSCMRLSSNWFLSTVYYYQNVFDIQKSFNIIDLVHIS
jgi:hypothetical protein